MEDKTHGFKGKIFIKIIKQRNFVLNKTYNCQSENNGVKKGGQ